MTSTTIHIFSGFGNNAPLATVSRAQIEEVVLYGECRLRHALVSIAAAKPRHSRWMQICLQEELVSQAIFSVTIYIFNISVEIYYVIHWCCYINWHRD